MTLLIAMALFSFSMSISPGPVNMVIIATSANHGVRRTLPFVSGATIGFTLLLIFIGFWLIQFIERYPVFFTYLNLAGCLFICYLGYQIVRARTKLTTAEVSIPGFRQGFLLQWLNPKAWIASAAGVTLFASPESLTPLIIFFIIYFIICYLSLGAWAVLGMYVSLLLNKPRRMGYFNLLLGGSLILTAVYMLLLQF